MYQDHETPRFWLTYSEGLKNYIARRINDKRFAEDVLHDVYIKIFSHCKRFDFCCEKAGVKNLRSWVFQVCHNTLIDHQKKNAKYFYPNNLSEDFSIESPDLFAEKRLPLEHLIKTLPARYSEVLMYDIVFSMKQADIAKKMGLTLSATKSRIQRGKQMLCDRENRHGEFF